MLNYVTKLNIVIIVILRNLLKLSATFKRLNIFISININR